MSRHASHRAEARVKSGGLRGARPRRWPLHLGRQGRVSAEARVILNAILNAESRYAVGIHCTGTVQYCNETTAAFQHNARAHTLRTPKHGNHRPYGDQRGAAPEPRRPTRPLSVEGCLSPAGLEDSNGAVADTKALAEPLYRRRARQVHVRSVELPPQRDDGHLRCSERTQKI